MIIFALLTILFSVILVGAQILWKAGINDIMLTGFDVAKIPELIINWKVLLGSALYVFAIFVYFYLQSSYEFSKVQLVTIPVVLVFSVFAGVVLFKDELSAIEFAGVILIFIGVITIALNSSS